MLSYDWFFEIRDLFLEKLASCFGLFFGASDIENAGKIVYIFLDNFHVPAGTNHIFAEFHKLCTFIILDIVCVGARGGIPYLLICSHFQLLISQRQELAHVHINY